MKRFVIAVLLAGCSAAELGPEATATQSQAASTLYGAANSSASMPYNSGRFCRMEYFSGVNAHAGAPVWPNGAPKEGATTTAFPPTLNAFPYNTSLGTAVAYALCQDKADFGITGGQSSDVAPFYLLWNTSYGQNTVDGTVALWSEQAFCWLNGLNSLSTPVEMAEIYPPPGGVGDWQLHVNGKPAVGASAKCVHPNRSWTLSGPYMALSGAGPTIGPWAANSFCGFTKVYGNIDNGWVWIRQQWGYWTLEASGVTVEMRCANFP